MKLLWLSIKNMLHRPLNTMLSLLLLTLGVGMISLILQIDRHLQDQFTRNIKGIDMVLGAKGSPLQLILSAVYQIDDPTGNISWEESSKLSKNGLVEFGIPLSYGDSHKGYRIVGTDHSYPKFYQALLSEGRLWNAPFEVTLGATVAKNLNLRIGDSFHGAHGFTQEGEVHEEKDYVVVGIHETSQSVVDQLILTASESVWKMHHEDHEAHDESEHHENEKHDKKEEEHHEEEKQITAMLIRFKSPMGMVRIPRMINESTNMQAAVPAYEIDRLFGLMGISIDVLKTIALILVMVSGLSIFISLYSTLKQREYEMALMRSYGASRSQLMWVVLQEGLLLSSLGFILGVLASKIGLLLISSLTASSLKYSFSAFAWIAEEWWILALTISLGLLASIIPAIRAYHLNISKTLANA